MQLAIEAALPGDMIELLPALYQFQPAGWDYKHVQIMGKHGEAGKPIVGERRGAGRRGRAGMLARARRRRRWM